MIQPKVTLGVVTAFVTAGLVSYALSAGGASYAATGDSYPGAMTAVSEVVGYFLATAAGAVTFGGLLWVVVTARPDDRGVIDAAAFRAHVAAERLSVAWALLAALLVIVQGASDSGAPAVDLIGSGRVVDAVLASPMARTWLVVCAMAAVVAVTVRLSVRWLSHVLAVVPAAVGVIAPLVSGNAGQGPDHDYATSAAIVFGVALAAVAGFKILEVVAPPPQDALRRVVLVDTVGGAVALAYGALLFATLSGPGVWQSSYGRAGVAALAIGVAVVAGDAWRLVTARSHRALSLVGAAAALSALALIATMATQPAPALLAHPFTSWDVFLGYALDVPPSVATLVSVWRFDTFIGSGGVALAAAYLVGYLRLRRRGDAWPAGRLAAWLAGCLVLVFASSSGVKAYGSAMFSVHMAEHMTLNMFIPVLLVLGGPVTLALRALPSAGAGRPPGPREWLLWLVHSKATAFLSHPVTAFVLFVASLYAVYFTPLFDTLVRYHWGHELMSVHFLLVGYLFYWGIIGIDPGPRKLPFLGRLGLLFAVMPFHAFFGIATMSMANVIGGQFYRSVGLPWLANLHDDQHLGGAIAWGSSELPVIVVVIALIAQWARQDRRAAVRSDRHADSSYADDDLDAYNAMLRELARNRR